MISSAIGAPDTHRRDTEDAEKWFLTEPCALSASAVEILC
jgi:hypothetical protein